MRRRYDLSNLSVLAVDDSQHMLRVLRTMLTSMGVSDVRTFDDPEHALADLRLKAPDIVFTDWVMAPIDGGRFIRAVRDEPGQVRFVPVVVLTAHASHMMVGRARDHGADYTLCKPVSIEHLYRAFAHLLKGDRSFVQIGEYFGPDRRRKARPFEFSERRLHEPEAQDLADAAE